MASVHPVDPEQRFDCTMRKDGAVAFTLERDAEIDDATTSLEPTEG
jgi:hypothetical protein